MEAGDSSEAFAELEGAYFAMEAFLEEEHRHLMEVDWAAMAEDMERREALSARIAQAEEQRQAWAGASGLGPDATWGDILGPGWEERREALRECAQRVPAANEENVRLMQEAYERNERLIAWLTDNSGEPAYSSRGEEMATSGSGLLSRKV